VARDWLVYPSGCSLLEQLLECLGQLGALGFVRRQCVSDLRQGPFLDCRQRPTPVPLHLMLEEDRCKLLDHPPAGSRTSPKRQSPSSGFVTRKILDSYRGECRRYLLLNSNELTPVHSKGLWIDIILHVIGWPSWSSISTRVRKNSNFDEERIFFVLEDMCLATSKGRDLKKRSILSILGASK